MLDGYKKRRLPQQPLCEALLVRRLKSVKTIDSTVRLHQTGGDTAKGYKYHFLFIFFTAYCLFHFCFSFYNQFLLCVSCSFFRITDKLLPFDLLSILILDKLCMNLLCLYRYFL